MAKAFFFQSSDSTWVYGSFLDDGITPDVEYTVPAGLYRRRWQTVNTVDQLSILNANNLGELAPFRSIPITDVAKDLIGTAYADKAEFNATTLDFFLG